MISLSGRSAVVTGASRGIGARLAESLGRQGATVFLIARNEQRLKELAGKIKSSVPVSADVTDPASVDNARERITAQLGGYAFPRVVHARGVGDIRGYRH
ncbi:MAG: SDR family NAD(P)-dependent oxidoreductase [Gemmatimonadaceae bacterium]